MFFETSSVFDSIEWFNFLRLLSVERTEPFAGELSLPFEPELFTEVMHWARARLEVHYAPMVASLDLDPEFAGSKRAWDKYRKAGGVLSDEALHRLTGQAKAFRGADLFVFSELDNSLAPDLLNSLIHWFTDNFGTYGHPVWQWPGAIELLLDDDSARITPMTSPPLSRAERQHVNSFRIRHGFMQRQMEFRFQVISYAATATLSSPWEAFLQAAGGRLGNHHPWLGDVGECLKYRVLRREWTRLTAELGPNVMEEFVLWVKSQEVLFSFHMPMPDPPTPL